MREKNKEITKETRNNKILKTGKAIYHHLHHTIGMMYLYSLFMIGKQKQV